MTAAFSSKNWALALAFAIALLVSFAACKRSKTDPAVSKHSKIDACALITGEEVQAIQGSPVKDTKGSEQSDGSFRVAQCFYSAETFNKSVSLAVTQADPASPKARNPRDFWKETFGRFDGSIKLEDADEQKKKNLREMEEERGQRPPKKLEGVGDGAFWTANRVNGALYVLKGDVLIRISVGGPDSEDVMIDRCKALAKKALSRL
jgi:hypothetical protein